MQLRHLRSFVTVAEERHFGRAARRLGVAQSAVSRHVAALEADLGAPLLVRTSRRTELTPAGEAALQRAVGLLDAAAGLEAAVRRASGRGAVTVAFTAHTAPGWLAALLGAAAAERPELHLTVDQLPSAQVADALLRGDADLAVARAAAGARPGIVVRELAREPVLAAVPEGADADGLPLVVLRRAVWPAAYDRVAAAAGDRVLVEAPSVAAALALVAAGRGTYRIAASLAVPTPGVTDVPVPGAEATIALLRREEPMPAPVAAVEDLLRRLGAPRGAPLA